MGDFINLAFTQVEFEEIKMDGLFGFLLIFGDRFLIEFEDGLISLYNYLDT